MALVAVGGTGFCVPEFRPVSLPITFLSATIDATGEKVAFSGRVFFSERTGTKNISRVGFRFGTVTKAGGSGLTVSLQDVSLTGGPPMQPDETQDQTVAVANGDSGFASNVWYRTGALSANRTVTYNDRLSVVIEFDGSGRLGSDTVGISALNPTSTQLEDHLGVVALKTGGSWAIHSANSNVILEFSDGTFGALESIGFPASATNTHTYNSGSSPDEYALQFQVPFAAKADGAWIFINAASGGDFDVVLYDGSTALATTNVDYNELSAGASARYAAIRFPSEVSLSANTTYRLAIKPTTTNSISVYSFDVSDANHLSVHPGGTACTYATRSDAGSWTTTATRRLFAGVRLSQLHDGSGGGGMLIHPGLSGGMRG